MFINVQSGRIRDKSMMFAPMMLPTDKSAFFLTIDVIAVTNSGSDVPTARIVTPIMPSGTFNARASSAPLSLISCAPQKIAAAPTTNNTMFLPMSFFSITMPVFLSVIFLSSCFWK